MRPISRRLMLGGSAVLAVAATLAACSNGSSSGSENGVYLLNFKPEAEEALKTIASAYKDKTGVEVKIVTAASGTYQQTLQTEVAKSNPPTIFNINGPVGLATWKDYALDLSDTEFVKALTDTSMALTDEDGVRGAIEDRDLYGVVNAGQHHAGLRSGARRARHSRQWRQPDRRHDAHVRLVLGQAGDRGPLPGADAPGPLGHRGRHRRAHRLPAQ